MHKKQTLTYSRLSMIKRFLLLDSFLVHLHQSFVGICNSVHTLKRITLIVSSPIGCRVICDMYSVEDTRVRHVRSHAKVNERTVTIDRCARSVWYFGCNQLNLRLLIELFFLVWYQRERTGRTLNGLSEKSSSASSLEHTTLSNVCFSEEIFFIIFSIFSYHFSSFIVSLPA